MRKFSFFWKIFAGFSSILFLFSLIIVIFSFSSIRKTFINSATFDLERIGFLLSREIGQEIGKIPEQEIDRRIKELGRRLKIRITVILLDGRVIADSEKDPLTMDNHGHRPEIRQAYEGRPGVKVRFSRTVKEPMLYVAVPIKAGGKITGVLRTSLFLKNINALTNKIKVEIIEFTIVLIAAFFIISLLISRSLTSSIRKLNEAASKISRGDFKTRIFLNTGDETEELANAFNLMAENLEENFKKLKTELSEIQIILSSISEGLVLLDKEGKIILSNPAFKKIVGNEEIAGKFYWEVVRSPEFLDFVRKSREGKESFYGEITIMGKDYLYSASLVPETDFTIILLHDISEMKRLERIKRDFVINASHEFKTPLTSIKGFIEALEQEENINKEYLEILKRNTERLINITNDMITIASLESGEEPFSPERINLKEIAKTIGKLFENQAKDKGIKFVIEAEDVYITGDPFLIEQVFVNLIDNALKYTERGRINLKVYSKNHQAIIEIEDTGIGIPKDQLERIFERFYVVDKSRSRAKGGTGLGLSIVRHIILKHNGKIEVESEPGKGTTFRIFLPLSHE